MNQPIAVWIYALLHLGVCAPIQAQSCVGLLADVSGRAVIADNASAKPQDWWPATLLQCLPAGKVLSLPSSAHATLFFPVTGTAIDLKGAGRFEILQDTVRALGSAPAPEPKALNAAYRQIQIDRAALKSAGVRMRLPMSAATPMPIGPRGIVLSPEDLVFRWEPVPGQTHYRFELAKRGSDSLYKTTTDGSELVLPSEIHIVAGEPLKWRVDVGSAGGNSGRWQEFVLADDATRALAGELDIAAPTPTQAERNLREVLL